MNYTLLKNGIDSLKSVYTNSEDFKAELEDGRHYVKDSVIYLSHGIEILLKHLIAQDSQSLLFVNTDKYIAAKKKKEVESLKDVFDADPYLRTITLDEAMNRIEYICDIKIPKELKAAIHFVKKQRNKLMHFGISLNADEMNDFLDTLEFCYEETIKFSSTHIPEFQNYFESSRFSVRDTLAIEKELIKLLNDLDIRARKIIKEEFPDSNVDQVIPIKKFQIRFD